MAAEPSALEVVAAAPLPRHEALRLLEVATGRDRPSLLADVRVPSASRLRFDELVRRRLTGEPLQYLEGTATFGPLDLTVDPRVLIPRPETEQLFELAVARLPVRFEGTVVDLCTGSGNLALALKYRFPAARVIGTDISPDALEVAAANVRRTGLDVELRTGDLFDALDERLRGAVDLLVANPPYLAEAELTVLPDEVRHHEPTVALIAGPRGDELLVRIAEQAGGWLAPGGMVLCEISEFMERRAAELFAPHDGRVLPDLTGRPRFVVGRRRDPSD